MVAKRTKANEPSKPHVKRDVDLGRFHAHDDTANLREAAPFPRE